MRRKPFSRAMGGEGLEPPDPVRVKELSATNQG
jgi:hypothetical protein